MTTPTTSSYIVKENTHTHTHKHMTTPKESIIQENHRQAQNTHIIDNNNNSSTIVVPHFPTQRILILASCSSKFGPVVIIVLFS